MSNHHRSGIGFGLFCFWSAWAHANQFIELEQIVVQAERPEARHLRETGAIGFALPEAPDTPPATTLDLIKDVPGVAENGQGGHFQNYSVRGMSRHRVMTQIDGVRIVTERRAGVSASFIDPLLLEHAEVQRGALTTFHGSGALGGVVHLQSRWFGDLSLETGFSGNGNQNYQVGGMSTDHWSMGIARRHADNGETADGDELNSHFTQYSGVIDGDWEHGSEHYQISVIPALARDVGKPNIDFPDKITRYPREKHLIANFRVDSDEGWGVGFFAHPNSLDTEVVVPGEGRTEVEDRATDFGASAYLAVPIEAFESSIGVDYFGRRGVDTEEREWDRAGKVTTQRTLYDGREDEWDLFASIRSEIGPATSIQLAGRLIFLRQENGGSGEQVDESAPTAHVGLTHHLSPGLSLMANLSHGVRFATLSERYYMGTTGRGQVIGDSALDAERANSLDLGLSWGGTDWSTEAWLFYSDIDDFIERVEVAEDVLSYRNLTAGRIEGIELSLSKSLPPHWSMDLQGQWQKGESEQGEPLADVPSNRVRLQIGYENGPWLGRLTLERRASKNDPGSGEQAIPSATLLSGHLTYRVSDRLSLGLFGSNLLNEEYFNSADRKANPAEGRSLGMNLRFGL